MSWNDLVQVCWNAEALHSLSYAKAIVAASSRDPFCFLQKPAAQMLRQVVQSYVSRIVNNINPGPWEPPPAPPGRGGAV